MHARIAPARPATRQAATAFAGIAATGAGLLAPGIVAAALTVTPITWNVAGLDSNNPASGPRHFPVGARVCSSTATTNVAVNFVWDSANAFINTRPGSLTSIAVPTLPAGACADAYFEVEIAQNAAAFDTTRRYRISAADSTGTATTPAPRELYVERLVSQSRNEVSDVKLDGVSVPPGGTMTLLVGGTYNITLVGATATQGYNQLESFINFPNTIFRVLSVSTTYTSDTSNFVGSPNDRLYADACGWENHPSSPNYRSCVGVAGVGSDGKAGGGVVTTYTVQILSGAGTTQPLNTLIYDFSGSSYHYNGDYAAGARIAQIVAPVAPTFTKTFAPSTVLAGGTSMLAINVGNANPTALGNVSFSDPLPVLPAQLLIAASPVPTTSGCGPGVLTAVAGTSTISLSGAVVAANGTCTINVPVAVPALPATGSYANTTGPLSVNGSATALTASATLNVVNAPPPSPGACTSPVDLARWTMDPAQGTGTPPARSYVNPSVASASASFAPSGGTQSIITTAGDPANSWGGTGWNDAGIPTSGVGPYFQVTADTSKFYGVRVVFDANPLAAGDWGNAQDNNIYVWSSADGGAYSSPLAGFPLAVTKNTWTKGLSGTAAATGTSTTSFRISINGANKAAATLALDNIRIVGCAYPVAPTLAKAFSPNPITVGGTSTLTFTLTNANAVPLTGAAFSDQLPASVTVASPLSATTTCGGALTWSPTVGASTLTFSGGTIPASGSCTAAVNVTASSEGAKLNVSDFIRATESGANTAATGVGTATLNVNPVITPPVAAKSFSPATIASGQTSILTATLYNTNASTTLTGVQLSDAYPGAITNANPLTPAVVNSCGGTLTTAPGGNGFSLTGVTLAPGASCAIEIPVTASTLGTAVNTTAAPQSIEGGAGVAASANLTVVAAAPAISLSKKVRVSPAGPWLEAAVVSPGTPVDYRFVVENIGNVPFSSFSVADPLLAGTGADPAGCVWQTANVPSTLPGLPVASATLDPTATCVRGPVNAIAGAVLNTATATGVFGGGNHTGVDDATYLGAGPNLSLLKEISTSPTGPWVASIASIAQGANVHYRFTVINNGASDITGISITDPMVSTASCSYIDPLPAGGSSQCVVGPVITAGAPGATIVNTATVNGTSGGGAVTDVDMASYRLAPASADVSLVKTLVTAGPFTAGQSISYSLVVANAGPDAATSVQVADTPGNLTITGVSGDGCAALPCTIASIASGGSATINVTATINAAGAFDNSATVTASETDPVPGNNTDGTGNGGTAGSLPADLAITKTDGTATVTAGQDTTYAIVVTNNGPGASSGIVWSDTLPSQATFVSLSSPAGWTCTTPAVGATGTVNCDLATLAAGASATFSLAVNASASTPTGTVLTNTATVGSATGDPVPGNNSASDSTSVTAAPNTADLSISKSDGIAEVSTGAAVTYEITVSNAGPDAVTGAILHDPAVAGLVKTTVTCGALPSRCVAPPTVTELEGGAFALPALAAGQSYVIRLTGTVTAPGGTVTNVATVAAPAGITDPVPGNDTATDVDNVVPAPTPPQADLAIAKVRTQSLISGGVTTYEVTAVNNGPGPVADGLVVDVAPAGVTFQSWTCTPVGTGSCNPSSGAGSISSRVTLPPLESVRYVVQALVTAPPGTSITNQATVSVPPGMIDPNAANNAASESGTVGAPPVNADLAVTKTNNAASLIAGSTTTYVIRATNLGPGTVTGALLSDLPAAGVAKTAVACSPTPGSCVAPPSVAELEGATFALPTLASGAFYEIAVTATVTAAAGATVTNVATITAPAGVADGNAANDSATDADPVTPVPVAIADLAVTKTNGATQATAGQQSTYTMVITNNGPDAATSVVLTDALPAQMTFNSLVAPAGWGCTTPGVGATGTVSCSTPGMPAGVAATFTVSVTVVPSTPGGSLVSNTVTVNTAASDPVLGNNQATDTDSIAAVPATVTEVPTLSEWALIALSLLLAAAAARGMRARRS